MFSIKVFSILLFLSCYTLKIHGRVVSDIEEELRMHPYIPSDYFVSQYEDHPLEGIQLLANRLFQKKDSTHKKTLEFAPTLYHFAPHYSEQPNDAAYWRDDARKAVRHMLKKQMNKKVAKNAIFFLGDGMSINTVTSGRQYVKENGIKRELAFDKFPFTGLSMTYCADRQVADSASTATAYLTGVKANFGTIGVSANVEDMACLAAQNKKFHTDSIATWSQARGKRTGLVTTARVTHASPAGIYAHVANRNFESDSDVIYLGKSPEVCSDIAYQLVHSKTGKNLNVIMGGGRKKFFPEGVEDGQGLGGERKDGRNLVKEWEEEKENGLKKAMYVENRTELLNIPDDVDYVMGLFNRSHMSYNLDRDPFVEPSLEEMVEAAIKILKKEPKGYFLFVEGARIDMGHHDTKAHVALEELSEFSKAVQKAVDLTNEEDTLIIVTADHAHAMTYNGYPSRDKSVLGDSGNRDLDKLGYMVLSYANGPGYRKPNTDGSRLDITAEDRHYHFQYPSMIPLSAETHGGDDVAIFARGPWSHLFTGVMEQNVIPYLLAYATCVGDDNETACGSGGVETDDAVNTISKGN